MIHLSDRTLDILKNMGAMSSRVCFKAGNRILQKPNEAVQPIMEARVAETFPIDFQIYNIDKFVQLAKMMDEPKAEIDIAQIRLFDVSGREALVRNADINVLRGAPDYTKTLRLPSIDAQFKVTPDDWKAISRSSSIVAAPQMAFIGDGQRIRLSTYDVYNKNNDSFSMEVGDTTSKFTVIIDLSNLKILNEEYDVSLSFKGLAEFKADDVTYWVAASEKSTYA